MRYTLSVRRERRRHAVSLVLAGTAHFVLALVAAQLHDEPRFFSRDVRGLPLRSVEVSLEFAPHMPLADTPGGEFAVTAPMSSQRRAVTSAAEPQGRASGTEPGALGDTDSTSRAPSGADRESASRLEVGTPRAPRLSLSQLGVGGALPRALLPAPRAETKQRRRIADANARLAASLAEGAARRDLALGLGAHGAVLSSLERITLSGNTPASGSALFLVRVNEHGKLSFVDVLETAGSYA